MLYRKTLTTLLTHTQRSVYVLEEELWVHLLRYLRCVIHYWSKVVGYWQFCSQLNGFVSEPPRTTDSYVSYQNRAAPIFLIDWSLPDTSFQVVGEGRSHNGFTMIDPSVDVPCPSEMRLA